MAREGNRRMAKLTQSEIRAMTSACARVQGINMAQGVCDTPAPSLVIEAADRAMRQGINTYTRSDGLPELRHALARKLAEYNGITADPETEITVSAGATGAFHCACLALLNPGDEVIVFEPYYAYHISALIAVEAIPRVVRTQAPDWTFSPADVERAITSRTAAIVVNTPANPSGKVFSRHELEAIAELAGRHDLFVFTDEIYEYFLFDDRKHVSLASLPGMGERTITISGYSKTFSITGWRIGYSVAQAKWASLINAMNDLLYVCAPAPLQFGVAVGIQELGASFYQGLAREYQAKRDRFCQALSKAGLPPSVPQGAYYVLADASRLPGATGKDRAMYLLEGTGVAGVPGEAFFEGPEGHRFIRFCFAKTDADLDEACRRLDKLSWLTALRLPVKNSCVGMPIMLSSELVRCGDMSRGRFGHGEGEVKTSWAWITGLMLSAAAVSACSQPSAILRADTSSNVSEAPNPPDRLKVLEGVWEYEDSGVVVTLKLDEQGNGTYPWNDGELLTLALSDHTWTGTWRQPGNGREGGFEVRLSDDYSEGEGRWWYTRIADDTAPTQPGGAFHLTKIEDAGSEDTAAEPEPFSPQPVLFPSDSR